jgi:autotransporter-associated beta strand protein
MFRDLNLERRRPHPILQQLGLGQRPRSELRKWNNNGFKLLRGAIVALFATGASLTVFGQIGGTGWVPAPVTFHVQSPTNAPQDERYWFTNNIYHCLVYSNDGAFEVGNTTRPRTEQRFTPDYTSGEIQYQSMEMAPSNENSYCVFQIHTGDAQSAEYGSTTFMLFWFTNDDGSVHDYSGQELAGHLGNKWFQLNVDHNLATRTIKVWINRTLVWTQEDNGAGDFYFKDGVYEQNHNPTYEMDTYISNILIWTNSGSPVVPLTWTGQTNGVNVGTWDLGTTADWVNSTNGAVQFYQDGSAVTFNDSAPGDTIADLQTLLQPASVTVSNAAKNYTFTGNGSLSGSTGLAKYGSGALAMDASNSFTGGVFIGGGTLQAGNAAALGSSSGGAVITNGGTLDVNGFNLTGESVTVSGAGAGGSGAIINNGAQQTSALRNVTLAGDTTFGGTGRWDIRDSGGTASLNSSPPGSPFNLTKVGTNQVSLVGVGTIDPALGDIDVRQGTFAVQTSTVQLGDPAKTLTVEDGATLDLWTLTASPLNKQIVLNDGATVFDEKGPSVIVGPITLQGNAAFDVADYGAPPTLTVSNVMAGNGGLTVAGGGDLVLAQINPYTGATAVNQGILTLAGEGSISGSATIGVAAGATLDASDRDDGTLTLAGGQTLTGGGTIAGKVIVGSGATLAPGGTLATLTFSNNLTLDSGSITIVEVSTSPLTNDTAQVAGTLTYGGTLTVTNVSGNALAAGDSFKLFDAGGYSGSFTNLEPPTPGSGLAWTTAGLTNGVLGVIAAAPPEIGSIQLVGGNLVVQGGGGSAHAGYYVLTSTNLALPLSQWTPITTNVFDGNGNFIFTNSLNLNVTQCFYRLQAQ